MTILLHKPYLVKVTTKGERGSKMPKKLTTWFMDDPSEENAYGVVDLNWIHGEETKLTLDNVINDFK